MEANASSNNRNTAALNNGVSTRANASAIIAIRQLDVSTRVNASSNNRNTSALNNGVSTRANASSNNRNTSALNNGVSTRTNASTSSATSRTPASTSNAAATARPTSSSNANAPNVNAITPARRPPSSSNANSPTINAITPARRPTTALNLNAGIALYHPHNDNLKYRLQQYPQSVTSTVSSQSLVNVQMRPLAFYDVIEVLLAPSRLSFNQSTAAAALSAIHRALFQFPRPKQIAQVDAIIRLCAYDVASMEREQDDNFPPRLTVEVNYERISLPYIYTNNPGQPMQVENGPATPIAISNMKSLDRVSNVMKLAWHHDNNSKIKNYAVSINLMKRRTGKELVQRLRSLGVRDKQWTKEMSTATDKDVCAQTPIKASLACPVGKIKMNLPCRALPCKHLQCFDAETFICMQEKKPFRFSSALYVTSISTLTTLESMAPGANLNIEIEPDGTWAPAKTEKERTRSATTTSFGSNNIHDTINLDDDDDEEEVEKNIQSNMISSSSCINVYSPPATSTCDEEPEVIDLDSSSSIEGDDESRPEAVESDHHSPPCSPPFSSAEETAQEESESCSVSSEPPTPSSSQSANPNFGNPQGKKYRRIVTFDDSSDSDSQ
ncbi:E3 SUMO-protein ligase PIAS1 [Orchesella cincta]|uniref:E3 SUMO-protein ligase PIAS1 n=1 Tax=Orchesella cincta TaxID=48709 RepID=A0A1D2M8T6_ORCCI|nr:E3 SUMO-protein ligase PIAS1 [Orchesella cincta]